MSEADAVDLLRRLVACNTSNPPGNEAQAAAILEEYLEPLGVSCERVAKDPARPNLIARLKGRGGGPSLAFLGHFDTVQARREDWHVEPFSGAVQDGAVYGRGTVDMKCQVVAAAVALGRLAQEGFVPEGDLMLVVASDEEVGSAGVGTPFLVGERPDLRPDFLVGEGAGERYETPDGPVYLLDRGVKCSTQITVTVRGQPADASLAGAGANAIEEVARLVLRLREAPPVRRVRAEVEPLLALFSPPGLEAGERVEAVRRANEELGAIADSLTSNVFVPTTLVAQGPTNVVPEIAELGIYAATLPGLGKAEIEQELRAALGEGRYELEVSEPEGGLMSDPDTPLRRAIEEFVRERDPDARLVPTLGYGFSDCHSFRDTYGTTAYGFIPFREAHPSETLRTKHAVDEHVHVADFELQIDCALHVARRIGSGSGV